MSDIIEDQKIHYIVKDYRRMFNNYQALKAVIEEQNNSLKNKDKEILVLRAKVNELKKEHPVEELPKGRLKGLLNEIESITNSLSAKLQQSASQAEKISNNVEEFRKLINV